MRDPSREGKFAQEFLQTIVDQMGCTARVEMKVEDDCVYLTITGEGIGKLIGRRGQTLDALQAIVSAGTNKGEGEWVRIVVGCRGLSGPQEEPFAEAGPTAG